MTRTRALFLIGLIGLIGVIVCLFTLTSGLGASESTEHSAAPFPRPLDDYGDSDIDSISGKLAHRVEVEPFNLVATLIFFLAIIHTFMSSKLLGIAHRLEHLHAEKLARKEAPSGSVSIGARALHFVGEVETVFGIWAIVLLGSICLFHDWGTASHYVSDGVNFTEAIFIIVIMTLASSRPILKLAEAIMARIAGLLGGSITAWWFTILTFGPLLGSLITEPAAITISAMLLARKFYELKPSRKLKYATIGLLFVNTSIGGTLTHFAAPPVLMVAAKWDWTTGFMLINFGWKAILAIGLVNTGYYFLFRSGFAALEEKFRLATEDEHILKSYLDRRQMESEWDEAMIQVDADLGGMRAVGEKADEVIAVMKERLGSIYVKRLIEKGVDPDVAERLFDGRFDEVKLLRLRRALPGLLKPSERAVFKDPDWDRREDPVPAWVTIVHVAFMLWTIVNAHHTALFVPGLLFYLAFAHVTAPYQNNIDLKSPLLVGFFLGGLLIHGGVQAWWIEPVLGSLSEIPLMLAGTVMTAFNDNAAITYLATLIPGITDGLKYAIVAGAVAGGGLTVIANAPNPAGQAILKGHFDNGVSPGKLLMAAIGPTAVVWLIFLLL